MTAELKTAWVAALRGGRYKQGRRTLRDRRDGQDAFCCLGVLGDCAINTGVIDGEWSASGELWVTIRGDEYYCDSHLEDVVLDAVGLSFDQQSQCIAMNDGIGDVVRHTFDKIADWIEQNV